MRINITVTRNAPAEAPPRSHRRAILYGLGGLIGAGLIAGAVTAGASTTHNAEPTTTVTGVTLCAKANGTITYLKHGKCGHGVTTLSLGQNSQITTLTKQVASLTSTVATLKTQLASAPTSVAIGALQATVSAQAGQISSLQSTTTAQAGQISALQSTLTGVTRGTDTDGRQPEHGKRSLLRGQRRLWQHGQ